MSGPAGQVAVAVLAGGRGSRLGGDVPKPLVEWRSRPLVAWALDAAVDSGLRPVVLVTGYRSREVRAAVAAPVYPPLRPERMGSKGVREFKEIMIVHNRRWRRGIASSLHAALDALAPFAQVGAVCVGLADQPEVGPEAYRRLVAAFVDGAELAVATYAGRRANPVLLSRSLWTEANRLEGDVGARALMQRHPVVDVPCDDTGDPADVDTAADFDRLNEAGT
jgi:molybdenum cofactor cytidylyltransferase